MRATARNNDYPRFLLLEGRAKSGKDEDVDSATVMDVARTEQEARQCGQRDWGGYDAIWLDTQTDELRRDLPPAREL